MFDVIETFGRQGAISDEVRDSLRGLSYSSVTARYKALAENGMIVYPGERRKGKSGRTQRVMVARTMIPRKKRGMYEGKLTERR